MKLLTKEIREKLIANYKRLQNDSEYNPEPVVKFFTPDGSATWLITELDPEDNDTLFGLCDLGMGCPDLGYVSLSELESVRGGIGLPIERDLYFKAKHTLSEYADLARDAGGITS